MILHSPENAGLAQLALIALHQSATGKKILQSHPQATVRLISTPSELKTYFQATGGKNHTVHLSKTDRTGLLKFLQNPANTEFAESIARLAHELIHTIHSLDDHAAFKRRNQGNPKLSAFNNQEEELTITGQTLGMSSPEISENEIRAELNLSPRISH